MADTATAKASKVTMAPSTVQFKQDKSPVDTSMSMTVTKSAFTFRSPSTPLTSPTINQKPANKSPDLLEKSLGDYYFDRFEDKVTP